MKEVLEFVKENDVKFIRLNFCDIFGFQKNISIMADELESAFVNGVSFDAHVIRGFRDVTESDLFLFPDPSTLAFLPWRPGPGRVIRFYCDIKTPDGMPFEHDTRAVLKKVTERAKNMGYSCKVGAECEFYLFHQNEINKLSLDTLDKGTYMDIAPIDRGEDIRREICLTLQEMGIKPESSHHEQGPGQNEIDFKFDDAVISADNLQSFKIVVNTIASRNGLTASFMPRPLAGAPGNGMHINLSLFKDGNNIFKNVKDGHSKEAESFIAGVLDKTPEITLFLNPITDSYERLGKFEAPKFVSWSHQNRSQLIRIPAATGEKVRMEMRSPDPIINPYLSFALIISAGLDGVEKNMPLPPAFDGDLYSSDNEKTKDLASLPDTLKKAVELAEKSELVKKVLGEPLFNKYISIKREEACEFSKAEEERRLYEKSIQNVLNRI